VACSSLNIQIQKSLYRYPGFLFPAGWYFIIVFGSRDLSIQSVNMLYPFIFIVDFSKTGCVLSSFMIS
jgi:hypothetical protein